VFDQCPSAGEPGRTTSLGEDRHRADRRKPGDRRDQIGQLLGQPQATWPSPA
jgi:hypothetical protein